MRTLSDHIVSGDQAVQLKIEVMDEPGQGGANHEYAIAMTSPAGSRNVPLRGEDIEVAIDGAITQTICSISFQNGPIKEFGVNGITQEALLAIVIDRLRSFQAGPFACDDNANALHYCQMALGELQNRTLARIKRGVEGTHAK